QRLALHALADTQPLSRLAHDPRVSRQFLYQQGDKAQQALDHAFAPDTDEDHVLFPVPVTKAWLQQLVLGLVLSGRSSLRGVSEPLAARFDYPPRLGSVPAIGQRTIPQVRAATARVPLAAGDGPAGAAGGRYQRVPTAVAGLAGRVVRASRVAENLN